MPPERVIRCGVPPPHGAADAGSLFFTVDDRPGGLTLRIEELSQRLVANVPAALTDLIEVAAYIYAVDSAVSRGGPTDRGMGASWRRRFHFEIPVRSPEAWRGVNDILADTLSFLSDDDYRFTFSNHPDPRPLDYYFDLGMEGAHEPEETILFSGGLDSTAGALEELLSRGKRIALVSHSSSQTLKSVQAHLVEELQRLAGDDRVRRYPMTLTLKQGVNIEGSHRTRSFLFGAIGVATAHLLGHDRVIFFENGVMGLNLPIVGQVVGSRATRSTHPQSLAGFARLFSALLNRAKVENPFVWRTKAEVVRTFTELSALGLVRHTRSCANVREMTTAFPHCGRCSQCIDRRFAVLASGIAAADPAEAYAVDLFDGERRGSHLELALGYVRAARRFSEMTESEFLRSLGEASRATAFLDGNPAAAARRIFELHQRHGDQVTSVVDGELSSRMEHKRPIRPDSLLALVGRERMQIGGPEEGPVPRADAPLEIPPPEPSVRVLTLSGTPDNVELEGYGEISGACAELLTVLGELHLRCAGRGLKRLDFLCTPSRRIADQLQADEDAVRKQVSRVRKMLRERAEQNGQPRPDDGALIENLHPRGYRLNPLFIDVVRVPPPAM
jgi:hypothetical protein